MKATLQFDLNKPEDRFDFELISKTSKMATVLWEMGTNCRKYIEWEIEQKKKCDKYEAMDIVFKKFYELCQEYNINLDELCQ
jgi:hypothetical protein